MRILVTCGASVGSPLLVRLLARADVVVPDSLETRVCARLDTLPQGARLEGH